MARDGAISVGEVGRRRSPGTGIRVLVRDIVGNAVPPELPHPYSGITPLHGHDTAAVGVEPAPVARGLSQHAASGVRVRGIVAIRVLRSPAHLALDVHITPVVRVQRHLVAIGGVVHGLHDVDLAVLGPVARVGQPQRRPRAAAVGRVLDVEDEQTILVLRLGGDAHGEAACRCIRAGRVAHGRVDSENS